MQVAGSQLRNPPVKFRQERWLHLAIDQHPACPNRGRLELWPRKWFLLGQNPWRWACWSIYSLVDLHVDRRRWRSHQLTSDLKRCLLFRKCLRWSSRKAVSVPTCTSVIGGVGAPERPAISILCVYVCMCVIVVTTWGWADVGLWVAVCFLVKISLHRPTCKSTFARLTQSQAISQSFRVFISFRSSRDTTFFHFSKLFNTKLPFPLPWWSKDLLVDKHAGGG